MKRLKIYSEKGWVNITGMVGQHGSESTVSYGTFHDTGCYVTGNKGGFMAQHEHTIVVTDGRPLVLTEMNEITSS